MLRSRLRVLGPPQSEYRAVAKEYRPVVRERLGAGKAAFGKKLGRDSIGDEDLCAILRDSRPWGERASTGAEGCSVQTFHYNAAKFGAVQELGLTRVQDDELVFVMAAPCGTIANHRVHPEAPSDGIKWQGKIHLYDHDG